MDHLSEEISWGALESKFRDLQSKQDEHQRCDSLRANWSSDGWRPSEHEHWYLSGSEDERIQQMFEWLAERAAIKLGHSSGPTAIFYWLDLLKRDSPNFRGITGPYRAEDGTVTHPEICTIDRVCEASADYCLKPHFQSTSELTSILQPQHNSEMEIAVQTSTDLKREIIKKKLASSPSGSLTIKEAATYFDCVPKTIRNWVFKKRLCAGTKRGTVTNSSIRQLEKKDNAEAQGF